MKFLFAIVIDLGLFGVACGSSSQPATNETVGPTTQAASGSTELQITVELTDGYANATVAPAGQATSVSTESPLTVELTDGSANATAVPAPQATSEVIELPITV